MALIHQADLIPSKIELVRGLLARTPWFDGDAESVHQLDAYRFDDPDGEVGLETHLLLDGSGGLLQVPLTYRGAPLEQAEEALVGTLKHSVLGRRWVYDGCLDPVFVAAAVRTVLTGARQADLTMADTGRPHPDGPRAEAWGDGEPGTEVPELGPLRRELRGSSSVIDAAPLRLVVPHRLPIAPGPDAVGRLTGRWHQGTGSGTVMWVER